VEGLVAVHGEVLRLRGCCAAVLLCKPRTADAQSYTRSDVHARLMHANTPFFHKVQHEFKGVRVWALYGHLSGSSMQAKAVGCVSVSVYLSVCVLQRGARTVGNR
jgi:hypothetical protein